MTLVLINDEARMANDEGMTKSEAQSPVAEPASTQALDGSQRAHLISSKMWRGRKNEQNESRP
jgi:hypothetical protein